MHLVSVCHRRDLWIWRHSQHYIARNITAKKYSLIVDDCDFKLFSIFTTSPDWNVVKASDIIDKNFFHHLYCNLQKCDERLNFGWYWQQLLKMEFVLQQHSDFCLIWDSDTIPFRQLSFPSGVSGFYTRSSEFHSAYWQLNASALGGEFGNYPGFSFVSQFFGVHSDVLVKMVDKITINRSYKDWKDVILSEILLLSTRHRLSEYELMGSFMLNTLPSNMFVEVGFKWYRDGSRHILNPLNPDFSYFDNCDYAAFERRDIPRWSSSRDRLLRLFYRFLSVIANNLS